MLNESETRAEYIDPALKAAGWGVVDGSRVLREHRITPGRIQGAGRRAAPEIADYVLVYRTHMLAVVEAKRWDCALTEGLAQAKLYAQKLAVRFCYSTNGHSFYSADLHPQYGIEGEIDHIPSPDELWQLTFGEQDKWRDRFAAIPYETRGGTWELRYYQQIAVERVLEKIAAFRSTGTRGTGVPPVVPSGVSPDGLAPATTLRAPENLDHSAAARGAPSVRAFGEQVGIGPRILLTLATGTGKTAIAFQIAWKLFHARWNLDAARGTGIPPVVPSGVSPDGPAPATELRLPHPERSEGWVVRRPRILFLTDRNILADQAYNAFSDFPEDALVRIKPDDIRKKGRVPKNGSIFFTIFQTFMSGPEIDGKPTPYFGAYPPDFFDLIIIDECHRGGANDESNWRAILDYFAPAAQLGLTATPKRKDNIDTYKYFGEPVFIYSLKEGINDGFLTPFKVRQIATTLDEYVYTSDDTVVEGEVEQGKRYEERDFNRTIEITERERYRVKLLMQEIDQCEKTLVFCATQLHAIAVRDLINQSKSNPDPNYCVRVTANDGALGEQYLRAFQDNEKTIPTILTTSQKLSTGVDARNIRNIVLLRPVNSMIEFKQIIGRGTRLYDGKDFFTIYDFVKAHHHFNDPEWDGEPIDNTRDDNKPGPRRPEGTEHKDNDETDEREPRQRPERIVIRLADGKERILQSMSATSFWNPATGTPMSSVEFLNCLFGVLPDLFHDETELRKLWSLPSTRKELLARLADKGFGAENLAEMQKLIAAENSDIFDVLAYVRFALPTLTRETRATAAREHLPAYLTPKQEAFLAFVLAQYVKVGVEELDEDKLTPLLRLRYHAISDAVLELGDPDHIHHVFVTFQESLYRA